MIWGLGVINRWLDEKWHKDLQDQIYRLCVCVCVCVECKYQGQRTSDSTRLDWFDSTY